VFWRLQIEFDLRKPLMGYFSSLRLPTFPRQEKQNQPVTRLGGKLFSMTGMEVRPRWFREFESNDMAYVDWQTFKKVIRDVERNFNSLGRHVEETRSIAESLEIDRHTRAAYDLLARIHSQARNYTNLVMVVGYAGILTLWSQLGDKLPHLIFLISGALLVISLLGFVSHEIFKMLDEHVALRRAAKSLEGMESQEERIKKFNEALNNSDAKSAKWWLLFFVPTLVTGVSAALILMGFFVWGIVNKVA
jgi:hypothetical protein